MNRHGIYRNGYFGFPACAHPEARGLSRPKRQLVVQALMILRLLIARTDRAA